MSRATAQAAQHFRQLHRPGDPVLLANCWDAGSARLIERCGATAMATTSAGLAWAHGYPDGDTLPLTVLTTAVAEIVRVISVPLSVDVEGGYSTDPDQVGRVVTAVLDAGGVGINIEDGWAEVDLLAAKIGAARAAGERAGVPLFINARTDVYLKGLVPPEQAVEETLRRAAVYRDAGADGIFAAGINDAGEIRAVAAGIGLPLNVLVVPSLPDVAQLGGLGVARVSAGSGIAQTMMGVARDAATEFLGTGRYARMMERSMDYAEINALYRADDARDG